MPSRPACSPAAWCVTKGSIVMRGAQLDVRQDNAGNQFGVLKAEPGKRAFFRQKRDTRPGAVDEYMEGEAELIEYDGKADTVRSCSAPSCAAISAPP
jgi:lipopolysaccharide export system protein LptA